MTEPKELNRVEVWVAEHAVPIFLTIAALIILGAAAVIYTYEKQGDTAEVVHRVESQVTRINQAICDARSLESEARARRCAERIRVGLVNCRRYDRCRAAFIAALTYPPPARPTSPSSAELEPEGGGAQNPSNAGQQPSPGKGPQGGNGGGDQGNGQGGGQGAAPAPSPGSSGPAAPEGGPAAESPGNGAQGAQGGSSSSGAGVEVCALERTCVDVEVGLDPKGLIP